MERRQYTYFSKHLNAFLMQCSREHLGILSGGELSANCNHRRGYKTPLRQTGLGCGVMYDWEKGVEGLPVTFKIMLYLLRIDL